MSVIRDGGIIAVLVLILWGSLHRWWVPGWLYVETKAENAELRAELKEHNRALDRSVRVTGSVVEQARREPDIG